MHRQPLAAKSFLRAALRSAPAALLLLALPQPGVANTEPKEVGGQFCTYKESSVQKDLEDFTTLGTNATDLWVGAILEVNTDANRGPQVGSFRQKNLPAGIERKPYKIVFKGWNVNVAPPSLSGDESA